MPIIKKSADLRNNYSEVSDICHKYNEPVFVTRNGEGDLAVMSIEAYEELASRKELYEAIDLGLSDIKNKKSISEDKFKRKLNALRMRK
jgi:prevent-host-death family protein